jgi:hypothetical protein
VEKIINFSHMELLEISNALYLSARYYEEMAEKALLSGESKDTAAKFINLSNERMMLYNDLAKCGIQA